MNVEDVKRFCRDEGWPELDLSSKDPQVAILKNHKLVFNYLSETRGCGTANIMVEQGENIEGVLFDLSDEELYIIDEKERHPRCYHRLPGLEVTLKDGLMINNVLSYKVVKNKEKSTFQMPSKEYMNLIITGAEVFGLSSKYIQMLRKIPTKKSQK